MKDKAKAIKITTIITVALMFICIIILACQFVKISNYRAKESELNNQKQSLINEIYNYNTSNSYYKNNRSEYLEDYAREHLTWGKNDENWYTSKN